MFLLDVDPTVPTANSLDFCPGSAKKGVKQCHLAPCISNALDIECIDSGSVQPNTSIAYEQCDTSFLPLTVVTGCQCRASSGFELNVTVHDADNNNPIPKIKVSFDGIEQTTNVYGNAVITIPFSNPNPVITLIDPLAVYLPSSKPLTITSLFGSEKMYMLKKGAPINIDPTKQNTLPMIPSSPNVKLEIPPNAFRTPDGKLPNGTVKLSISVFPPSLDIGEKAPGVFSARTSDGMLEELETQGVFTLTATDSANTPLNSGPIRVQAGNNFRLFELGGDGNWVLLTPMAVNKRRAADLTTFVGTISINTQMVRWYNIDKFSENSKCWVKLHVFDPITNELFQQASDTSYRVSIVETFVEGDTTSVLPMRYYLSTQHQCLEVRCNNPRTGYVPTGYFVMEVSIAFQNSLITIPSFPWPKENYAMPVQTILTALNYSTNNESPGRIKINMNASSDGVFFDNVTKCEMKTLNAGGNSLVFSAARPTSADPYNGTSQRCVARVRVNLDNFSSVEVSSPLNFTSTSIWGNSFFRAYGQTSDFNSTSGKIVFCMEYRCSTAGEQTSSSVTLNDGVFAQVRFYCNSSFIAPVRSTTGLGFFLNNQSNVTAAINECNGNTSDFALDKNCTGMFVLFFIAGALFYVYNIFVYG
ncbi:hypothetical protein DPMN_008336 [Dreissena polymorpha]|uniref:Uncharacterized protein n=1 Tax=Dreissena polymorpha TaxID=45954 RepID=A0A9D4MV50_DREPO|nr:hypothetical protein DPMN_008336 [Dreissena polymorpha]